MDVDRNSRTAKHLEQSTSEERTPLNDDSDNETLITEATPLTSTMGTERDAETSSHSSSESVASTGSTTRTNIDAPEGTDSGIVEDAELMESPVVCTDDNIETDITEETTPQTDQCVIIISEDSVSTLSASQGDMCRICHCVDGDEALISPCECNGSMKFVHQTCLQKWVKSSDTKKCELCGFEYNMTSSVKPFRKWSKLNMTSVERRKVLCSVTFHVVAITCVIWSLYVLIERTTTEIQEGKLNWPFWTKLVVVAIGFTGGVVFMYVQCKMYVQLFRKWKQFNRVIYINNVRDLELENDSDSKTNNPNISLSTDISDDEENKTEDVAERQL